MADEATIYHEKAVAVEGVCEPDSLVIGDCVASEIKISVAGEYNIYSRNFSRARDSYRNLSPHSKN